MPLVSGRTPVRSAAFWALLFHSAAALWLWLGWGGAARGSVLFWMDLPLSVAWAGASGVRFLATSLVVGGAWWALLAGALAALIGRSARGRPQAPIDSAR